MRDERQIARHVANMWLDGRMNSLTQMVPDDPDCDACRLARSYLRALEKIERMKEIIRRSAVTSDGIEAELLDEWPKAIQ